MKIVDHPGKSNSVPNKPSLNGSQVAKLFNASALQDCSDQVQKVLVNAERDFSNNGTNRRIKLVALWKALEDLRPYFTGLTLTPDQQEQYRGKIENWGRLCIKAFGEQDVTHYMVSSYLHRQPLGVKRNE